MCLKSYYSRQLKKNAKSCPPKKALPLMNMKKWTTFELFVLGLLLGTLGTTMEGTHKLWSLSSWLSWEHGLEGSIRKGVPCFGRHLYKIWYSELGIFLGTIHEERQTLALLNDFLGNTSCGVFLGWSGSHWEPTNYLVRDSLGLLSLGILAKYCDDMTSMNSMGR